MNRKPFRKKDIIKKKGLVAGTDGDEVCRYGRLPGTARLQGSRETMVPFVNVKWAF